MRKASFVPLSHMSTWFRHPMYLFKYIFVNIVYQSYTILFIAVRIKNVVDMSGNKQFVKHLHVCHSLDVTALRQHITSALWQAYSHLRRRQSYLRCSILWCEGRKISALLVQNFQRRPASFWHVFGTAHGGL